MTVRKAVVRKVRGPSISRVVVVRGQEKQTAYGVCKQIWSSRGTLVNQTKKLGEVGVEIKKSVAIGFLESLDKEAASPFVLVKKGRKQELVAA